MSDNDSFVPDLFFYLQKGLNETDNNSDKATPVPIPNTAVKLIRVNGIGTQFGAERVDRCRSHPSLFPFISIPPSCGIFYVQNVRI